MKTVIKTSFNTMSALFQKKKKRLCSDTVKFEYLLNCVNCVSAWGWKGEEERGKFKREMLVRSISSEW